MATYRNYHQESGAVSLDVPVENIPNAYGGGLPDWFQSGAGSPVGSVTPSQQGALYQDTTNGALYEAVGVTSADWRLLGGVNSQGSRVLGISFDASDNAILNIITGVETVISDKFAQGPGGSGNRLQWNANPDDGAQLLQLYLGPSSAKSWQWKPDGGLQLPNGNSIYNGAAAPDNAVGADGHIYHRAGGTWSQVV